MHYGLMSAIFRAGNIINISLLQVLCIYFLHTRQNFINDVLIFKFV